MPGISLTHLTDETKVRKAMAEYDRDAEAFLARRGFGRANKYFLVEDGRTYDSKAIAGRAYELQHRVKVYPTDFSGGLQTVARALERLGFHVTRPQSRSAKAQPWDEDEMLLALHWYLRYRKEDLDAGHPGIIALSDILARRANARGRPKGGRARSPAEVARQLAGFRGLDPRNARRIEVEPSRAHEEAWASWASKMYARTLRVEEILGALDPASAGPTTTSRKRELAASWGVVETSKGYRTRRSSDASPGFEPMLKPAALLSPKSSRRKLSPRTAAAPRIEDPELFDRANEAHESVREELSKFLESCGFTTFDSSAVARRKNVDFDLAANGKDLRLVIEVKSMPLDPKAEAARLRVGLGQVLWYRHRFFAACGERRVAVLVVERQPRDHEEWRAACREVGVVLTWSGRLTWLIEECRYAQARG